MNAVREVTDVSKTAITVSDLMHAAVTVATSLTRTESHVMVCNISTCIMDR